MKNFFLIFILSCLHLPLLAQTQSQLNLDADAAYKKADIELNKVYREVLEKYKKDRIFINKLRHAQRIWIIYRDAEAELKFPSHKDFGSAYPMCVSLYLKELTEQRTSKLKEWLNNPKEGDLCNGSIN